MKSLRQLWFAPVAWFVVALGSTQLSAQLTETERQVVDKLIGIVDTEINAPAVFQPVNSQLIRSRCLWLFRTLDRLEEYIDENPNLRQVPIWKTKLRLSEIRRELAESLPNTRWLKQIRDEDLFVNIPIVDDEGQPLDINSLKDLENAILNGQFDKFADDPNHLGYHIVASFSRALYRYSEVLDDDLNRSDAQDRLIDRLKELKYWLTTYRDEHDEDVRKKNIKAVHSVIGDLETCGQVPDLTETIGDHYLREQVRVFVSSRILTYVAGLFPIPSQPVDRCEDGTLVQGTATPLGHLRIVGVEHDRIGVLEARYDDPIGFEGMAYRRRVQLGVSACLDASFSKRFFAVHGAPDSAPAESNIRILTTDSSKGRIIDRIVDRSVRRNFDGQQISNQLEDDIDDMVTKTANTLNPQLAKNLKRFLRERGSNITRVRAYRSGKNGIQATLLSALGGFQNPVPEPPHYFGVNSNDVDFAVCIRRGLFSDLLSEISMSDRGNVIGTLRNFVERVKMQAGLSDDPLQIWFPLTTPAISLSEQQVRFEFLAADSKSPAEGYLATVEIQYDRSEQGLALSANVSVPNNDALEERIQKLFDQFSELRQIGLLQISADKVQPWINKIKRLDLQRNKNGYFTLSGALDLNN